MPLSTSDAARLLRFCLASDDAGSVEERDDGARVITIVTAQPTYQVHTFEELSFETALRAAAAAGVLRAACVEKQIAFTVRNDGEADGASLLRTLERSGGPATGRLAAGATAFLSLTDAIGALLHQTQRERGISTMFVGSGGKRVGDKLADQWRRTDRQRDVLIDVIARERSSLPAGVERRLQHVSGLLAAMAGTRAQVVAGALTAPRVIDVYSGLNAALLGVIEAFMVTTMVGPPRNDALACVVLQHAKEKVGIERAQLSAAFVQDRFADGQRLAVVGLIAAQSTYLHIFSATARPDAEAALRQALTSPAAAEVQRMEGVVFAESDAGFGIDPGAWYTAISRKIDMLGEVSLAVISSLRGQV